MGRKKQNRVDRWRDEFGVVYRIGKARAGLTEENISTLIGLKTRTPLQARRKDPMDWDTNLGNPKGEGNLPITIPGSRMIIEITKSSV